MRIVGSAWFHGTIIKQTSPNGGPNQTEFQTWPRPKPPTRPFFAILTPFTSALQIALRSHRPATVLPTAPNKGVFQQNLNQRRSKTFKDAPRSKAPHRPDSLSSRSFGNLTVNVLPRPTSVLTVNSPPYGLRSSRQECKPSPVPVGSPFFSSPRAGFVVKNGSNISSILSSAIPSPVSDISKYTALSS